MTLNLYNSAKILPQIYVLAMNGLSVINYSRVYGFDTEVYGFGIMGINSTRLTFEKSIATFL